MDEDYLESCTNQAFYYPSMLPENQSRHLYQLPDGGPQNQPETDPQGRPLYGRLGLDQTLESAFSGLNLSSPRHRRHHHHHQMSSFLPRPDSDSCNFIGGSSGASQRILPPPSWGNEQSYANLQRRRTHSAADQMVGLDGTHGYLNSGSMMNVSDPMAFTTEPRLLNVNEGLRCSPTRGSFLHHKKQLGRFPILPCSNSGNAFSKPSNVNYDALFDDFEVSNDSNVCVSQFLQHINNLSLENLKGRTVSLARDQNGSRILQLKFEDPNEEEIKLVLSEVVNYAGELMKNQFGNNLMQKLIAVCNEEQRTQIIISVTKTQFQLIGICLNPHGYRAVLKLLEHLTTPQQLSLVMSALSPGAVALANDLHGHHIIQFCLLHFTGEENKHMLNEIADNCFGVATDKCGCCVLQQCVDHSQGESRDRLVSEIIANAKHLAEDPYGNYVLQHILGLRIPQVTTNLLRQLEGSYLSLSCNKYASNVVERCLIESGERHATRIMKELLQSPNASMLLLDPYGNFVMQSALSVSKGLVHNELVELVRMNVPYMRSNLYGKKVLSWFEKRKLQLL